MAKTEAKTIPQKRDKKVPVQLNASIDQKVGTKLNAFVAWLNMDKGEVCQIAVENLINEPDYAEFREGYAAGTIKAPPQTESAKAKKVKAITADANKARAVSA